MLHFLCLGNFPAFFFSKIVFEKSLKKSHFTTLRVKFRSIFVIFGLVFCMWQFKWDILSDFETLCKQLGNFLLSADAFFVFKNRGGQGKRSLHNNKKSKKCSNSVFFSCTTNSIWLIRWFLLTIIFHPWQIRWEILKDNRDSAAIIISYNVRVRIHVWYAKVKNEKLTLTPSEGGQIFSYSLLHLEFWPRFSCTALLLKMTLKIGFEKENWMFKTKKSSKKMIQEFLLFCSIGCTPYICRAKRRRKLGVWDTTFSGFPRSNAKVYDSLITWIRGRNKEGRSNGEQ